jgi:hypothetical protein
LIPNHFLRVAYVQPHGWAILTMSPLVAAVREYAFGVETLAFGYRRTIVHPVDAFATQRANTSPFDGIV